MKTIDAASTISRGASARRLALWGQAVAWSLLLGLAPACKREEPVEDKPAAAAETKAAPEAKAETKAAPAAKLEFIDPPEGPRAPAARYHGVDIGRTTLPEVEAMVERLGLCCGDTSARAKLQRRREKAAAEAKARGEDAVTSASAKKRSGYEDNPQIRYSCPNIQASQIGDRERPPSKGRLLFVFDSPDYPVRHTSYQRSHKDPSAALTDVKEAIAAMTAIYGEPTRVRGQLPEPDKRGAVDFEVLKNIQFEWKYADLIARVNILRVGNQSITIGERVEVPPRVRPDAPALARDAAASP